MKATEELAKRLRLDQDFQKRMEKTRKKYLRPIAEMFYQKLKKWYAKPVCSCGKRPVLKQNIGAPELTFSHNPGGKEYSYWCDCGKTGFIGSTPHFAHVGWCQKYAEKEKNAL